MLLQRVKAYISKHSLLSRGLTLAIGVSGGPDSIVLLHLLTRLREEYDLTLTAVHLDHGLRIESGREAEFVAQTAHAWGVACVVERVEVGALAQTQRLSIEEAGRVARYALFAKVAPTVAVAHNADDQAETVLMHFVRGSGMAGLRGMLPKTIIRRGDPFGCVAPTEQIVIRPLLDTPRSDIEAYIAEHNLPFVTDPTNTDRAYFRNRLRHELLPMLETYNLNIRERLRNTAEVMAGDYELLKELVEATWSAVVVHHSITRNDTLRVDFYLHLWRLQPLAMQRALLREAVARLKPDLRDADFAPIDHAARWSQTAESGHTADLLGGLCVQVVGNELRIGEWEESRLTFDGRDERHSPRNARERQTSDTAREAISGANVILNVPGITEFLDQRFTTNLPDSFSLTEIEGNPDPDIAYLDASLAPFTLRTRRAGERFQPLGMEGTTKLSDFMINRKLPVDRRETWPLLCCGENGETVLWVCGYAIAEQGRVREGMGAVVRVEWLGKGTANT